MPGTRKVYPVQERPATGSGSKFEPRDTLFARITPCLENGKIAQYAGERPGIGSTEFFVLRARPGLSDPDFVYYFANKQEVRSAAEKSMSGASGRQRAIISSLSDFECEFPPLPTQKRIAGILSAYDDLIENCQRRISILEKMARGLYREWFVHFRFPGHEGHPRVNSPLGEIPEGWEVRAIADICEAINYGYTASASSQEIGPKFLRITDIVPEIINWSRVPFCEIASDKVSKYLLKSGDIVIARTGATTGYAKRLNKLHPDTVFASYLVRIRAMANVSNRMLGILMESDTYKKFIQANIGGAAQPQANATVLTSMQLVIPPLSIARAFDQLIEPMMDAAELLAVKIQTLRHTRDLLLPRLLSGQIEVGEEE